MTTHSAPETDRIAMLRAALDESNNTDFVPITEPLPKDRRQHLYIVPDNHDLGKKYGISQLSAILSETKTPHLTDFDPNSTRKGLRYIDNAQPIPEKLEPFTSDEARIGWRNFMQENQKEKEALTAAAQKSQDKTQEQLIETFPDPTQTDEHLKTPVIRPNSRTDDER